MYGVGGRKMIPLRVHNALDYVLGGLLILSPTIFGMGDIDSARGMFWFLGFGLIGYSLLTRYPYSLVKAIPLGVHMALDVVVGLALMLAPTVLGYRSLISDGQNAAHFVLGLGAIGLVALTDRKSDRAPAYKTESAEEQERKTKRAA